MTNSFYNVSGAPGQSTFGSSLVIRAEFIAVQSAFAKLPTLTGNAGKAWIVDPTGTFVTLTAGALALAGDFTLTGTSAITFASSAPITVTLPGASGTLATLAGVETLTNKTMVAPSLGTPTVLIGTNITGTAAGLTAGSVTTNANLTGPITSVGNATSVGSQTGTGSTFVMDTAPTISGNLTVGTVNKVTLTPPAASATITITNAKTFAVTHSLTLAGTDSTTMTFPTTSATVARTDAAQTFTGIQTFGTQSSAQGSIVLANTNVGAFPTTIKSSNSASAAWTFTLPVTAGTVNYVLTTDGSGVTSWASVSSTGSGGTTSSGNVTLTSASFGAQSITTTAYGQHVVLPDATTMTKSSNSFNIRNAGGYPLRIKDNAGSTLGFIYPNESSMVGCADSSSAAGVWTLTNIEHISITAKLLSPTLYNLGNNALNVVMIDSSRTLILSGVGASNLYGTVYNSLTQSWGTPTLIRTAGGNSIGILIATDKVLVASCNATTGLEGVVLTLSGTTITVNTAATAVNAANIVADSFYYFIAVGSSYVVNYAAATPNQVVRAMTVSGTTVTIGSESTLDGTANNPYATYIGTVSGSVFLAVSLTASNSLKTKPYTISAGTTITGGTGTSTASANIADFKIAVISSNTRWIVLYRDNAGTGWAASIISVSGSTSTLTTATAVTSAVSPYSYGAIAIDATKAIIYDSNDGKVNIVTDSAGTASAGTAISVTAVATAAIGVIGASSNTARFLTGETATLSLLSVDYTGSSAVLINQAMYAMSAGFFSGLWNFPRLSLDTHDPGQLIGTVSVNIERVTTTIGTRIVMVTGNNLIITPTKFLPDGASPSSDFGRRIGYTNNVCWCYNSTGYNPNGRLVAYECVS